MHNLIKVGLNHHLIQDFLRDLPHRPYCSNNLFRGLNIKPISEAIKKKYIQINPPSLIYYLVFNLNHSHAALAAQNANIPEPTFSIIDNTGSGQLAYRLTLPICISEKGKKHPIEYLAAIQDMYIKALGADISYDGLMINNPLNPNFKCLVGKGKSYTLNELAKHVDLTVLKRSKWRHKKQEERGYLGKNVDLFDTLRFWAYDRVHHAKKALFSTWLEQVTTEAIRINSGHLSVCKNEVKWVSQRVARWTWDEYTGIGSGCRRGRDNPKNNILTPLTDKQTVAAHETNIQRKEKTTVLIEAAIKLLKENNIKITQKSVAQGSGLSLSTIKRRWNSIKAIGKKEKKQTSQKNNHTPSPALKIMIISLMKKFPDLDNQGIFKKLEIEVELTVTECIRNLKKDHISKQLVSEKTGFHIPEFEQCWENTIS